VSGPINRLAVAVTGRRGRWLTLAIWALFAAAGLFGHAHLGDVTAAGQSSYLPSNAESTRVVDVLQRSYRGGNDIPVLIVFDRDGGLTQADLDAIGRLGDGLERLGLTGATPVFAPYSGDTDSPLGGVAKIAHGVGPISRDGEAALVALAIDTDDRGAVVAGVGRIRRYLDAHRPPGLRSYVTGPGGIAADLEHVAEDAGTTLLFATLGLVLLLLLLVYRAPILAPLPLLVVGAAYLVASGVVYLLIEAGLITVNVEGTLLLLVLIFGAGTDYSLLLVHRYREELGGTLLPHSGNKVPDALARALRESAPAIVASAGTVIAAMLVLLVAELESTHWLGPVLAIGVATVLVASLTLLPALLAVLGERAFWLAPSPRSGRVLSRYPDQTSTAAGDSRWRRVADLVRRRPRTIVVTVLAVLALLSLGNLVDHGTIGFGQGEIGSTESSRGTEVLDEHFPPGLGSPLTAVVDAGEIGPALKGLRQLDAVKLTVPVPPSPGSEEAVLTIVLRGNPYSGAAADAVKGIREKLKEVAPSALVGGIPAENYDVEQTNARDTRLIVPLVLLVVGLILTIVLRALVAPAFLIATVVASFAATLGLLTFAFTKLLGTSGTAFDLVLMSFIFLVALGVDYNIFLMTRAREEAARRGTREGILAALQSTGGVVTGAGVILAGTFATLTLLPLEQLVQIGATVAVGVLLDTFVVRALLIPSIAYLLGERTWWPRRD
jgi:RND superfamily putative drug exporter